MPMSLEEIMSEAQILPTEAKAILAEHLVASIEANIDSQIAATQLAEVLRRRDQIRSGKIKPVNGSEALAQVRAIIGQ